MSSRWAFGAAAAVLAALLGHTPAGAAGPAPPAPPAAGAGPDRAVTVTPDRSRASVVMGDRFTIRTRLENRRTATTGPLIAHLTVVSLTADADVDAEDWSSRRTVAVPALAPRAGTEVVWEIQAVNAGRFALHVVVLPSIAGGGGAVAASPLVHVDVSGRRTLNVGGTLPVVLGVPLLLGVMAVATQVSLGRGA